MKYILVLISFSIFVGCSSGMHTGLDTADSGNSSKSAAGGDGSVAPGVGGYVVEVSPLWDAKSTAGKNWTQYTFATINSLGPNLLQGSQDITNYCPSYFKLTANQKLNFWVYMFSAIAKYESNFNPTSRYLEKTMGIDPITGQQVYSEGLLQLSYQDVQAYPYCNEFNWSIDKNLSPTDPKKTILDPYKNLKCGIQILNQQVRQKGLIGINAGAYWYTLEPQYAPEGEIRALTRSISICK